MDPGAVVDPPEAPAGTVPVEQAIFTSIRSPLGRGYRIVAASSGISTDEKKEIVQCAPSHGSLCASSPTACGLASFELRSGRRCLFLTRNAGVEHTARGGCRVHTHVLVMDQETYRRFRYDPLEVETAALAKIDEELLRSPPTRLDALTLGVQTREPRSRQTDAAPRLPSATAKRVAGILRAVLDRRRTLVAGAPAPRDILRWTLGATPAAFRARLSVSYGLRFSPARSFQLVFADVDRSEAERVVGDGSIEIRYWDAPVPQARSSFDAWLRFVRERWDAGRHDDINRLSSQLAQEESGQALEQIATLCTDIERVGQANPALLDRLIQRHSRVMPNGETHARLLAEFENAVKARRVSLERAEQDPSGETQAATEADAQ